MSGWHSNAAPREPASPVVKVDWRLPDVPPMPMDALSHPSKNSAPALQIRIHGDASQPTLIYLPGLHGDWHLVASFRAAIAGRARWVEFSYPRTTTWSLDDYAHAVLEALAAHDIRRGVLMGESFGSQVLWAMLQKPGTPEAASHAADSFAPEAIVLCGGFVRHPTPGVVRTGRFLLAKLPPSIIRCAFRAYVAPRKWASRGDPQVLASLDEFVARRDAADRDAMVHRLDLIRANDFWAVAAGVRCPVFQLSGVIDPIVTPWPVRRWLRAHCPGYRASRIVWPADHNILGSASRVAADQILEWIRPWRPGRAAASVCAERPRKIFGRAT